MAIGADNKAYISYYDDTANNLKYATNVSGTWVTSTIDSIGYSAGCNTSSIAIDSDNKVHMSYYDNAW